MSHRSPFQTARIVSLPTPSGRRGPAVVSAIVVAALFGGAVGAIVLMSDGTPPPPRNRPQAIELSDVPPRSTAVPSVTPTAGALGQTTVRPEPSTAFSDREALNGQVVAVVWATSRRQVWTLRRGVNETPTRPSLG